MDLVLTKKKKKKVAQDTLAATVEEHDGDLDLTAKKKPKKKKKKADEDDEDDETEAVDATATGEDEPLDMDDERDYTYKELLTRIFDRMNKDKPELAGRGKRVMMQPPQVAPYGSRKTIFINFTDICNTMQRQAEYVLSFLLAELGTQGSIDGQQRLVLKGRFTPKGVENIIRRYISDYVSCKMCRSPDTVLSRDQATRVWWLDCQSCGARKTVEAIKAGYQAQIGKRRAMK